jgi:hypothetical protein
VATDHSGGATVSAPVGFAVVLTRPVPLLARNSAEWKYFDQASLPAGWTLPAFDDSAWPSGPGKLGYGDNNEATLIGFGGDPDARHTPAYFRRRIIVPPDRAALDSLTASVLREDGVIVG